MSVVNPFGRTGDTHLVVAQAIPAGVQVNAGATNEVAYRLYNDGVVTAFMAHGVDATEAEANAAIPTAGVPKKSFALPPGAIEILMAPKNAFWAGKTASSSANVYITPGAGV